MRIAASGTRDHAPLSPTLTRIQSRLKVLGAFYQSLYDDSQAEFDKAANARDTYSRGMYRGRADLAFMILDDLAGLVSLSAVIEHSESERGEA
ncbi:hypothetical protein ACNQFN_09350 [Thauera butanivorans]|uniref:hypothetical protein n=1 Tax=Thauera butanivorans TaxID=86174 RepID=UPI003AB4125D